MTPFLFASFLLAAPPPVATQRDALRDGDTTVTSLSLAPPDIWFSQSSDLCALLAGEAYAGFGANPVSLGFPGSSPFGLASTSQYASRLPSLNLPSFHNISQSFAATNLGGAQARLGVGLGFRSMALGSEGSAWEYSLGVGRRMDASGKVTQDLGSSLKVVITEGIQAPDGTTPSPGLLMDLGYVVTLGGFLRVGATVENLGRGVTGARPLLNRVSGDGFEAAYLSTEADPDYSLTPLSLSLGAALFRSWHSQALHILNASLAASWAKQPGEGPDNQSFTTLVVGAGLFRTLGCQWGMLRDPSSAEIQGKFGLSLFLFNHFRFAFVNVQATGGQEMLDGQRGFSLTLSDLQSWRRSDWTWWRRSQEATP